ncbi:LysE type translocator [uncultured archaeon]|nr:LysE type translocator [uncultured archaeon]
MAVLIYLLALGFVIGLSGALLPGPLLVYTISESLKRGRMAGPLIILGHVIVEVFLIGLIALGVATFVSSPFFVAAVSVIGGFVFVLMGVQLFRTEFKYEKKEDFAHHIVLGGMFFSAFNPGFPIWWATAGSRMLLEGYAAAGLLGVAVIVVGHWFADVGYFTLVSFAVHRGREKILTEKYVQWVRKGLALVLAAVGLYFLRTGLPV